MRKLSLGIGMVAISFWLCLAAVEAGSVYGTLKGRVINAANGAPIGNLKMVLSRQGPGAGQSETMTDQNGRYHFDNLMPGVYTLAIKSSEYDEHRRMIDLRPHMSLSSNFRISRR